VSGATRLRPPTDGRGDADRSEDPTGAGVAGFRTSVPAGEPRGTATGAARTSGRAAPGFVRLLHVRSL